MRPLSLALLVMLAFAGVAQADILPVEFETTVDGQTELLDDLEGVVNENGTFEGGGIIRTEDYQLRFRIEGDVDPALVIAIAVIDSDGPSDFSFNFNLPVLPVDPPSITGGSISGSLTDGNGDGATLTDLGGQPIYTALVNGSEFQTLLDAPFSVSAGAFESVTIGPDSFGLPGLTVPGPAITVTDMGINIAFSLSGGNDAASFTAVFNLEPEDGVIPEPATLSLFGLGLAGLAGRYVRRRMTAA